MAATAAGLRSTLPTEAVSLLFEAVLEGTEEAIMNSMFKADYDWQRPVPALDMDKVRALLKRHGR